ncbi:MAG: RnfABCDGE type electron transport complex subunit B [Spirochaetaceae bacterium]|jgi:Na+-translocating ferredoxin:NAD+ oxidoreductase RNF subunit RnfB|nr:RnfABCDGE type electron transport complex subunit B [Spirochaetaceae bacterium]
MNSIIITAIFALALAFILGFALGFFRKFFAVAEDPLKSSIRECLPGANCGACGYPGCDGYASALVERTAEPNKCTVGGVSVAEKIGTILGIEASSVESFIAVLACQGSKEHAPAKGEYSGLAQCRAAKIAIGGTKLCAWGCLGFGDCVAVCQFGALCMGADGLPHINVERCTGCGLCVAECPQQVLLTIPKRRKANPVPYALCSNRHTVKALVLKTCKKACIKCELCVKNCPQHCIALVNGIPEIDYSKCSICGTCVAKCPTKVLQNI